MTNHTGRATNWRLADGQALADEFPYTFHKPSTQAVAALTPGDEVKLIFEFDSDSTDAPHAERMWVEIRERRKDHFSGVLDNDPAYIRGLAAGHPVEFEARHIIQVSIEDPVPAATDRYLARCFVTHKVLHGGAGVGYLYREEPEYEDDSGWRIMAGDETEDYMDDSGNVHWVSLGAVLRADDRFVDLLDAPVGSAYERHAQSKTFVRIDD